MLQHTHGHGVGFPYRHPTSRDSPRCPVREDDATTKRRKDHRVPLVEGRRYVERMLRLYNVARQIVKKNHQQFNGFHRVASSVENGNGDACRPAFFPYFVELLRKMEYVLDISDIHPCPSSTNPHPGDIAVEIGQGRFFFSLSQPPRQRSQKAEQHPMLGICSAFFCYVATRHVRTAAGR